MTLSFILSNLRQFAYKHGSIQQPVLPTPPSLTPTRIHTIPHAFKQQTNKHRRTKNTIHGIIKEGNVLQTALLAALTINGDFYPTTPVQSVPVLILRPREIPGTNYVVTDCETETKDNRNLQKKKLTQKHVVRQVSTSTQ